MPHTSRWAKNRSAMNHKILGQDAPRRYERLSPEAAEFVDTAIREGKMTDWEISRQVFRRFGRDYSNTSVGNRRRNLKRKEQEKE